MTKKKDKRKDQQLSAPMLRQEIFKLFKNNPKKHFNPRQVIKRLQIENNKDSVLDAMSKLAEQGQLTALEDFRFKLRRAAPFADTPTRRPARKTFTGYVDMTRNGDAYIVCKDREEDVHVSARYLNGALHGDEVEINVWFPRGKRRPEGEVLNVLTRATEQFLGTLRIQGERGFVTPDKLNMPVDILVRKEDFNGAKDNDKVVVKITKWHNEKYPTPLGAIVSILSGVNVSDFEMKAILFNNGFPLEFPAGAIAESEELPDQIPLMEIHRRRDFRQVTTFTIDPEDAKDFDDALSIQYLENGDFEIGIHIADVSHYVRSGSVLDQEALKRSTSVYLVDRVLPMLPERISNNLCSLRPMEDRLTFSAVFVFDKDDRIKTRWFGKAVIHSNHRFSYEAAQKVIDNGIGEFAEELAHLNRIAKKLRKERFKKGSIDFEVEEVRFRLDEDGVPIEVFIKDRKEAHMLIEEFMLLANKEVAIYINDLGKAIEIPFVYRVHDLPDPDKVAEFAHFAKELGFQMDINTPQEIARSYNRLTEASKQNETLKILEPIAIRTMAKAAYSVENIGHYGLGFDYYAHFTSPIRRYSDVLAHRILEGNLYGRSLRVDKGTLDAQCKHISLQERKAMDAERESVKYKQAEFMQKHIGQEFDGYISGIIDRGIFVELEHSKCEGMVGYESMNEGFDIDPGRLKAVGRSTGLILKMGDRVRIRIAEVDLARRRIDMLLLED